MKPFHELTSLGQARRLRPHAGRVLALFGVESASLRQLTDATNIVFRVDAGDGRRLVLRMTSPKSAHSIDSVRAESAWVCDLHRASNVDVPEPIATPDGEYVLTLAARDLPGVWHCALFGWGPRADAERSADSRERRTPRCTRRTSPNHGERLTPPEDFRIRTYRTLFSHSDPAFPNPEPIMLFGRCGPELMPPERLIVFQEAHDRIQAEIDRLFGRRTPHVIHNDLHVWNVKVHRNRIYALDFEDLLWGHAVQDLATTLYYYRYRPDYEALHEAFHKGYTSVRAWPEDHGGRIEALIAGRGILLANFVAASQDTAERKIAPTYLARMEERLRDFLAEFA